MFDINQVMLIGRLEIGPQLHYVEDDVAVMSFPLVASECAALNGVKAEQYIWYNIVIRNNVAENASKVLKKGALVYLDGKLCTRYFEDHLGVRKYINEIVVENFEVFSNTDPENRDLAFSDNQ
jgi:single-strand DNA-binding protein